MMPNALNELSHLILTMSQEECPYLHFTGGETDTQQSQRICQKLSTGK